MMTGLVFGTEKAVVLSRIEIIRWLTDEEAIAKGFIIPEEETMARDYRKEYDDYHGTPEQKKRRAQRNKDNKRLKPGPGKEVHHPNAKRKGKSLGKKAVVMNKTKNRKIQPKRGKS